ncbi:MAG: Tetratricopeptide 2 repeat protein [Myxococcales bacterium]|nr:Tetratricopeptide 2 repeat protein [Myxococcales bacterium]
MNLLSVALAALFTVESAGDARLSAPAAPPPVARSELRLESRLPSPSQPVPVSQLVARIDQLHRRRDDRVAFAEEQTLVQTTLARAPQDFGVLWRAARYYFWLSDDPGLSKEDRSRFGKDGWDIAERAIVANPNHVAGYYWAAVCMGNYALGLGVMKALSQGMEGKFRDRLSRAEKLDGRIEFGAIEVAWGRFFDKLPWPKRDRDAAEQHFRRAIALNGANLRARVYLASSYLDQDRPADAKRLLDEVVAAPAAGRYDGPEERRCKAIAVGLMTTATSQLK